MDDCLRPIQLGYGSRGDAEAAVHSNRFFMPDNSEEKVLLKIDFPSAFNTVRRDALLKVVERFPPEYHRFI